VKDWATRQSRLAFTFLGYFESRILMGAFTFMGYFEHSSFPEGD
jgi:hypothetical protein